MTTHELKIWPEPFRAVRDGDKTFEVRENDRDFRLGDWLVLCEWDPEAEAFTGARVVAFVSYIVNGPEWGLPESMAVMALGDVKSMRRAHNG